MPHRPSSATRTAVAEVVDWLRSDRAAVPVASELVHGASEAERRALAMLGPVARALAGRDVLNWPDEMRTWTDAYTGKPPDAVVTRVRDLLDHDGDDVLACVYQTVVQGVNRRRLGTFFTPPAVVAHMLRHANRLFGSPEHVIDPGAGVGAFALAALRTWPKARISAVDVNVVTLGLLAARISARAGASRFGMVPGDFLQWLSERWPELDGPRLVLGNPPYTRHQLMTAKDKHHARSAAGPLISSGLAGLSTYFLAATIRVLAPQDGLCLLLPSSWCEAHYGRELREWLWAARRRPVELHRFPSRLAIFPGTQVMAVVLAVGAEQEHEQDFVVRDVEFDEGHVVERGSTRTVRVGPCPATLGSTAESMAKSGEESEPATVALEEHVRVRRGLVTGAREAFFLDDRRVAELGLPSAVLRKAVVRASDVPDPVLDMAGHEALRRRGCPGWLLDLNDVDVGEQGDELISYLADLETKALPLRVLISRREPWYVVERVPSPDLLFVPVSHGDHRVVVNEAGAIGSNNFFGLTLSPSAPWTAHQLAHWIRSAHGQTALQKIARHYQGGARKIEPRALRAVRVPAALPGTDT